MLHPPSPVVSVLSGVPQGTVLSPLMFCCTLMILLTGYLPHSAYLLMIVFYIEKSNPHMTQYYFKKILTYYLTGLQYGRWNLTPLAKCVVLRCSRFPTPFQLDYQLNDHVLDIKGEHPYLGITLHKSLSWTSHISKISTKASQTFNFLR